MHWQAGAKLERFEGSSKSSGGPASAGYATCMGEHQCEHAVPGVQIMQPEPHIIEQILDSARALYGVLRSEPQPIAVGIVLEHAATLARRALGPKAPLIEIRQSPESCWIEVDAARLERAIANLIVNAAEHTAAPEPVRVVAQASRAGTDIRISAAGGGLDPRGLSALPGERSRRASKVALQIGLARELVELQDGTIVLRAARSAAPSAIIRLPGCAVRAPHGNPSAAHRSASSPRPRLDGVHVLLVEDDIDALDFLALILRQAGASVAAHSLAATAYDEFVQAPRQPDIIVSDIAMPFEDGYSFISRVRTWESRHGRVPVPAVAVSAFARDEDVQRARAHGFDRHVAKPVDASLLVEVIASWTQPGY